MAVMTVNKRALRNEAAWLPRSLDDVVIVTRVLAEAEVPNQMANGIVGWLVAKSAGLPDRTSERSRAAYRKVLDGLESPLESPDSRSGPPSGDILGYRKPLGVAA